MTEVTSLIWLVPLGLVVGAYGTLVGAGGGFVLVPVLLLLYPVERPEVIAAISLAVACINGFSGSLAYARMRRTDFKSGLLFAAATVPGAVAGALTTAYIPRRQFDLLFALLLTMVAAFLLLRPRVDRPGPGKYPRHYLQRQVVEVTGVCHRYAYNPAVGVVLSLFVGYLSGLFGVGGGIMHVPIMVYLLNFPAHVATATSHFVLALTSLAGTTVHISDGTLSLNVGRTIAIAIGVVFGAQLGARLSNRVRGPWIIRGLAVALLLVAIRIAILAL